MPNAQPDVLMDQFKPGEFRRMARSMGLPDDEAKVLAKADPELQQMWLQRGSMNQPRVLADGAAERAAIMLAKRVDPGLRALYLQQTADPEPEPPTRAAGN